MFEEKANARSMQWQSEILNHDIEMMMVRFVDAAGKRAANIQKPHPNFAGCPIRKVGNPKRGDRERC
jgi:hypothetical protein